MTLSISSSKGNPVVEFNQIKGMLKPLRFGGLGIYPPGLYSNLTDNYVKMGRGYGYEPVSDEYKAANSGILINEKNAQYVVYNEDENMIKITTKDY